MVFREKVNPCINEKEFAPGTKIFIHDYISIGGKKCVSHHQEGNCHSSGGNPIKQFYLKKSKLVLM